MTWLQLRRVHAAAAKMTLLPILLMSIVYVGFVGLQLSLLGSFDAAWLALVAFLYSVPGASLFTAVAAVTIFWQATELAGDADRKRALFNVVAAGLLAVWFHFALHALGHAPTAEGAFWTLPVITVGAALAGYLLHSRRFVRVAAAR